MLEEIYADVGAKDTWSAREELARGVVGTAYGGMAHH